ncbi:UDP-glycosyltransferase UGT5 [Hyalella azteca]|uniref:UDP-glycosyltransferase UGT5 n=1 Tax=Hyalella azteca TaxID=294128 RepID=A0A8B7NTY0_HYAAZ|nr:UDP-glycosyltransferase UGT5 [Hyalella azteca]
MKGLMAQLWLLLAVTSTNGQAGKLEFFNSSLPAPGRHYKFLFLLPTPIRSHTLTVAPLAVALANRGHEVYMLCETPDIYELPNVTCIYHDVVLDRPDFNSIGSLSSAMGHMMNITAAIGDNVNRIFSSPQIKSLYQKRKEFDFIVAEDMAWFAMYPILHEMPFAIFTTTVFNPCQSAHFGNPQNPAYVTGGVFHFPQPFSILDRFTNLFSTVIACSVYRWMTYSIRKEVNKHFSELPPVSEFERNASLHFVTVNHALDGPLPLLPNQVAVGGLVLRPLQPLPEDIRDFLAGEDPVIYVGFGITTIKNDSISADKEELLIAALSKLPYKVILKLAGQNPQKIGNILFHNDVPQQTILAHRNVKVFVSHGGLAGTQEAIYYGVPIIAIPAMWDHSKIASYLEQAGVAIALSWPTLTEADLLHSIEKVMQNPSYRKKMADMSLIYRDQPDTPLDRAVFWSEYMARHKGAPHLQSPARRLSWITLLHVDLMAITLLLICSTFWVVKYIVIAPTRNYRASLSIVKKKTS